MKVNDDRIILDKTVADQVSSWKSSRGLTDKVDIDHNCSGVTCTYYQIGDVFVCEKTGRVHGRKVIILYQIMRHMLCVNAQMYTCLCIKFGANCSILLVVYAVCDDTCREVVTDTANDIVVCTISGHCFDRLLVSDEEPDIVSISYLQPTLFFWL